MENYALYTEYKKFIESKIEGKELRNWHDFLEFTKQNEIDDETLFDSIERMEELSPGMLFCYDILIAGVEYENFAEYMASFNQIHDHDQTSEELKKEWALR